MSKRIFVEIDYEIARKAFETCPDRPYDMWLPCILCNDFKECLRDFNEEKKNDRNSREDMRSN